MNIDELMKRWANCLVNDAPGFADLCAPDCKAWHSYDGRWMTSQQAMRNVEARGELPPFAEPVMTTTADGFICQSSTTLNGVGKIYLILVAKVTDGLVSEVMEYIAPEMEIPD